MEIGVWLSVILLSAKINKKCYEQIRSFNELDSIIKIKWTIKLGDTTDKGKTMGEISDGLV